jgi:hypothetical protein
MVAAATAMLANRIVKMMAGSSLSSTTDVDAGFNPELKFVPLVEGGSTSSLLVVADAAGGEPPVLVSQEGASDMVMLTLLATGRKRSKED